MAKITGEWLATNWTVDSATGDGSTTVFVLLDKLHSAGALDVFIDGLRRAVTTHYTVNVGTSTVTFVTAPAQAQNIVFKYVKKSL